MTLQARVVPKQPETEFDKIRKRLKKGQSMFLTAGEARGFGIEIEQDWLVKLTPDKFTFVTPDKWEIDPGTDTFLSPEGQEFTRQELTDLFERQQAAPPPPEGIPPLPLEPLPAPQFGVQPEFEGMLKRLYPDMFDPSKSFGFTEEELPMMVAEQLFTRAERDPEALLKEIYEMGRSPDTEALLRLFNPDMTGEQIGSFYAAPDPYDNIRSQIMTIFNIDDVQTLMDWAAEHPDDFYQEIKTAGVTDDTWNLMKTLHPESSTEELALFFQAPIKPVGGEFLQAIQTGFQFVEGWWKTGLMELGFRYYDLMEWSAGNDEHWRSEAEKILDSAYAKHGWKAIFSSEINQAWDVYFEERTGKGGFSTGLKVVSEFSNPVYFVPASKVATVLIRPFRAVPILGETMQALAKGVELSERALAEATLLPSLGRGIKWSAGKINATLSSKYLIAELPTRVQLREWLFVNNAFRKIAQKTPLLGKIAPTSTVSARLPEVLATRAEAGAAVIQETAMRTAIIETGQSTKGQALAYLRELGTTKEIYGVRNSMVNPKLVQPKGDYSLALGDVLQAPERYIFTHRYGFEYAKRTQSLMREMFALAKKEGVNINELQLEPFEEYVHWVVTGVKNKEGTVVAKWVGRPRGIGAVPSSMKPRRFESMLDGLKDGFVYADDVETYVSTYVDDMFKAIADHRYGEGMKEITGRLAKELGALPVAPTDRLWAYYPETARNWLMRPPKARVGQPPTIREAVADMGYAISGVQRLARGEQLAGSTLNAIKNRLPNVANRIDGIASFAGDRSTKAKLEKLIWKRMQAGQSIPATLPTVRKGISGVAPEITSEKVIRTIKVGREGKPYQDTVTLINNKYRVHSNAVGKGVPYDAWGQKRIWMVRDDVTEVMIKGGFTTQTEAIAFAKSQIAIPKGAGFVSVEDYVASLNKEQVKTFYQRFAKLEKSGALLNELNGELTKMSSEWWLARSAYAEKMGIVRKPLQKLDEGYIRTSTGLPHPMFNNQIYPSYIADTATKLLNEEVNALLRVSADISGAFRLQQAALDISAGMIQGFVGMFSHPVKWAKAQAFSIAAMIDPKVFNGYLVRHSESIAQRNFYLGSQRPFEYFEKMGLIQKWTGKLPAGKEILGQTYGRAEAAFSMFSTVFKDEMWGALSPQWIKKGQGFELARMLDRMTGMMSFRQLGMPANASAFLSGWVSFAPQYRVSVLTYFADAFKGGMTGAQVRKDIAKMVAGGSAAYIAFCQITDNPIYLNPYKDGKKFMSINVDGHWIGMGSAVVSLTRAYVDIMASALSIGDNEPMDFLTVDKWKNPIIRSVLGQSAVLPRMILEITTRRDFLGYPMGDDFSDPDTWANWGKWVGEQFTPIWLQEILYDKSGIPPSAISGIADFAGLRTSPQTKWETLDDKLKERKVWDKLTDLTDEQRERIVGKDESVLSVLSRFQKEVIWEGNDDLVSLYDDAQTDALIRGSEVYLDYVRGITDAQNHMTTSLSDALTFGVLGKGEDTRWLRERYNDVMNDYGLQLGFLRSNEDLEPIFAEFDEKKEEHKVDAETIDLAYWDYIEKVVAPDRQTDTGEYDFEEYAEALVEWRAEWGEEVYDKVLFILERAKEAIPDYPDWGIKLWKDRKLLNEADYWGLPVKPIYQMDAKDVADGLLPDEYVTLWEQYQKLATKEEQARFVEANPDFGVDWKAELRAANPEVDATLAFWGYGGSLQSVEAYNLVKGWADELGIPLSQIGLGLPPERVVPSYFEHLEKVRETSGSSAEVKLHKLRNPDLLDWGVAQRGWDDLKFEVEDALEIQVNYRVEFGEYDDFGNELSDSFVEDAADRREKRKQYYIDHPDFRDDNRRLDVLKTGVKDVAVIEGNVEYGLLVDEHSSGSAEALLYRYEHEAFEKWGKEHQGWTGLNVERVPIWEIDRKWFAEDDAYQAILDKFTDNKKQRDATQVYLFQNPEYATQRRVREALELGWRDETLIDKYVAYYTLPDRGYWKARYFKDNRDLYDALKAEGKIKQDYEFDKIPDVQYDIIYDNWVDDFNAYGELKTDKDRDAYLLGNPDFARDRLRYNAYGKLIPQEFIENYADYYGILFDGKPTLLSTDWYEDDWYLMENKQFYDQMVKQGLWKEGYKDFTKVPSRDVFKLYQTYLALPIGRPRYDYRGAHSDLDNWLVLAGKVSKSIPERDRAKTIGRWAVWAEQYSAYLVEVEELYEQRKSKSAEDLESLRRRLAELTGTD